MAAHERAGTNHTNIGSFSAFFNRVFACVCSSGAAVEHGRWNELGADLFEKIIRDLDSKSIVVAKSVCKSWHSAITRARIEIPPPSPWLVCPRNSLRTLHCYDSLDRNVTATIKLPRTIHGGEVCGSSKGWLVVLVKKTRLLLFDPLSGAHHELPCLTTIPYFSHGQQCLDERLKNLSMFRESIELSSRDISECIVALKVTGGLVACCRPKDEKWTIYDGYDHSSQSDAACAYATFCHQTLYIGIYHYRTRTPFVGDCKVTTISHTMRLSSGADDDDQHSVQYLNVKILPCFDTLYSANYLTESNNKNGQLIIALIVLDDTAPFSGFHAVEGVKLLELTPCTDDGNTFYVKRVPTLGDREIMFTGPRKSCIVHSTSAKLARDKENCICHVYSYWNEHYIDVFSVVDGKHVRAFPAGPIRRRSCWFWFTPNLQV